MSANTNVKIADFGTSRAAQRDKKQLQGLYSTLDFGGKIVLRILIIVAVIFPSLKLTVYLFISISLSISIVEKDDKKSTTHMTKGVGTLVYQAPELLSGKNEYDIAKADVFSFGVTLWEIFAQQEPYSQPPYDKMGARGTQSFILTLGVVS